MCLQTLEEIAISFIQLLPCTHLGSWLRPSQVALFDTASFKKMNILFEWIFMFLKKWIIFLNEYSGFWKNEYFFWMNILDFEKNEYFFWMNILDFYKMNNFLNKILVLVSPRQKWLSPNVSNSSEIIQGSLVGPISVHFRGSITYSGASGGLRNHILASFWNFE